MFLKNKSKRNIIIFVFLFFVFFNLIPQTTFANNHGTYNPAKPNIAGSLGTQGFWNEDRAPQAGGGDPNYNGECWGIGFLGYATFFSLENCVNQFTFILFKGLTYGVGVAGNIMDEVFAFSILNFSAQFEGEDSIGGVVKSAWEIFRDLANIIFIFVLLYAAILTIIGSGGDTKKIVGRVIIVAILINFSFFLTGLVIDASNQIALQFYKATGITETAGEAKVGGFGQVFLNVFEITELYKIESFSGAFDVAQAYAADVAGNITASIVRSIFGSILLLVTIFVFLAAAFMLLSRFIQLIFLLLLSPIAFVSTVLPQTEKRFKDWWNKLLKNSFYAPIFFLFLWVTLKIIDTEGFKTVTNLEGKNISTVQGVDGILETLISVSLAFGLGIGMLVASITLGTKLSIDGAATVEGYGKSLKKWGQGVVGGATFGGSAAILRNTIGRGSNKLKESDVIRDAAARGGLIGRSARVAIKGFDKTSKASFDARDSKVVSGVAKTLNLGSASGKGGYDKKLKDQVKEREDFGKLLGNTYKDPKKDAARKATIKEQELKVDYEKEALDKIKKTNLEQVKVLFADIMPNMTDKQAAGLKAKNIQAQKELLQNAQTKLDDISNFRQKAYADSLESEKRWYRAWSKIATKDKQAAEKIKKAYRKNKDQKAIDDLKSALKPE